MGNSRTDGHLDVLGSIPAPYRNAVLEQCERRVVAKGHAIWKQGQPAEYVAFLFSGKAMSSYQSRNGKTGTTGFWCAGDLLGAADLGDPATRQMTLRCLEECVIYTLPFERFNELVRRFPELAQAVIQALSIRLRWVAHLAVTLETQSAFARVCTVLLALSERFGIPAGRGVLIDLKLKNEDLAAIVGVSRQFTNSTLQDLQKRGLIATQKRNLVVIDPGALEALVYNL
ncbi:MAG: Crp/Fnr family transcriptional regulator [Betaproteobacteria bacterium]|nr:Crp/Fnr family transcriptional regulator [Betaproteobacteria bacterium]